MTSADFEKIEVLTEPLPQAGQRQLRGLLRGFNLSWQSVKKIAFHNCYEPASQPAARSRAVAAAASGAIARNRPILSRDHRERAGGSRLRFFLQDLVWCGRGNSRACAGAMRSSARVNHRS